MSSLPFSGAANLTGSMLATVARAGQGIATRPADLKPPLPLELYEFESCPYCRLVREALTELDLDALIQPCPKGGQRFRPTARSLGGREQFPLLVDPNNKTILYESADIVAYLYQTYAGRNLPWYWRLTELQQLGSAVAGLPRLGAGRRVRPSRAPAQPLELYSFESSPFARLVRERLCELEITYLLRSVGRSTGADWLPPAIRDSMALSSEPQTDNRRVLLKRAGRISVPYLVDPNSGTELAESADILRYLDSTYAA